MPPHSQVSWHRMILKEERRVSTLADVAIVSILHNVSTATHGQQRTGYACLPGSCYHQL